MRLGKQGQTAQSRTLHASRPRAASPYVSDWSNKIALCAMMKDEDARDVLEFITYHRWVGVDKIYLRENGNSSTLTEMLQPYVDAGVVDFALLDGPKHPTQTNWYNACSNKASRTHSWVTFTDLDEFIVVLNRQQAVTERGALKAVLGRSFRYSAAVSMQWVLFGSAGHETRPSEGQLKGFNRCTGNLSKQMKCLGSAYWFHPLMTFRPMHVHQCTFRHGAVAVLANNEPLQMWRVPIPASKEAVGFSYNGHLVPEMHERFADVTDDYQIVLFHYVTRSIDDFLKRKITRRSGVYATQFKNTHPDMDESSARRMQDITQEYRDFEHEHGFDGDHPICHQGGALADAIVAARKDGWSETQP